MEILLNDEFVKVEAVGFNWFKFKNLKTRQKLALEQWNNSALEVVNRAAYSSPAYKRNIPFINDRVCGMLIGAFVKSVGDSSDDFQIYRPDTVWSSFYS